MTHEEAQFAARGSAWMPDVVSQSDAKCAQKRRGPISFDAEATFHAFS